MSQVYQLSQHSSAFSNVPINFENRKPLFNTNLVTIRNKIDEKTVKVTIPHNDYSKNNLIHIQIVQLQDLIAIN
jgi:hypothetical protein